MFDKATAISSYSDGYWPEEQESFFQRADEPGLSQSVNIQFKGPWISAERRDFADKFNAMLREHGLL